MRKYKKIYIKKYSEKIIIKIIWARKGCWFAYKMARIGCGGLKIQELKFDNICFTD